MLSARSFDPAKELPADYDWLPQQFTAMLSREDIVTRLALYRGRHFALRALGERLMVQLPEGIDIIPARYGLYYWRDRRDDPRS